MKQALESLLHAYHEDEAHPKTLETITAIKELLAQPEQEPVAYLSNKRQRLNIELKPQTFVEIPTVTDWEMPLYMKPQQRTWLDLTDDEMLMIYGQQHEGKKYSLGRMVQQALKDKNI